MRRLSPKQVVTTLAPALLAPVPFRPDLLDAKQWRARRNGSCPVAAPLAPTRKTRERITQLLPPATTSQERKALKALQSLMRKRSSNVLAQRARMRLWLANFKPAVLIRAILASTMSRRKKRTSAQRSSASETPGRAAS